MTFSHTYLIAEVGQNHNGDMDIAKRLIDAAAKPITDYLTGETLAGVDAVKFTKRDLDEELSAEAGAAIYESPHSFGKTYLEHRQALELSDDQHKELEDYAREKGLEFIETLCAPGCLSLLDRVRVDAVKIASRDITNLPLLEALSKTEPRVILSTGMCDMDELRKAIEVLDRPPEQVAILHCLSQYPAEYRNINLRSIEFLRERFPDHEIGYSDHSIGIVVPTVAVGMGATIIEKHITLDRKMKGSDQAGSLEPEGLWRVVRDIRNIEQAIGESKMELHPSVLASKKKLARSLALKGLLQSGDVLRESDLHMISPGDGLSWEDRGALIGKKARRDLGANTLVDGADFE